MTMDPSTTVVAIDPLAVINEAISARNWPLLVIAILCVVVPILLTAFGKNLPWVSDVLKGAMGLFRKPVVKAVPVEPVKPPGGLSSVVSVVDVHEEKTK